MKAMADSQPLRCAIYTRKSTEEGLEQAFNSLDAQREACAAYAVSQRHEGWQVLPTLYDDGGWSGGNLARPALQRLLADIKAGDVDLVVVYKIDRLTRSLTDFSKLVEVFDEHKASFVSVTQHFNTTTSMGRLTLNVLLSFAQFEREVTGERIRDKVAASRRKGMWMGGPVPLGYSLKDKALVVDDREAALVRRIFERYCALGCVRRVRQELDDAGIRGKLRVQRDGQKEARPFSRGGLYALLRNRLYIGEVAQGDHVYPGLHAAIVPLPLWQKTQAILASNRQQRRLGTNIRDGSLLAGMIVDGQGQRLFASHTSKGGKRYRYYLKRPSEPPTRVGSRLCVPAHDIERITNEQWVALLRAKDLDVQLGLNEPADSAAARASAAQLAKRWDTLPTSTRRGVFLQVGLSVAVDKSQIRLSFVPSKLAEALLKTVIAAAPKRHDKERRLTRVVDALLIKSAGETRILEPENKPVATRLTAGHRTLLAAIAEGRVWAGELIAGKLACADEIAERYGVSKAYVARGLKCLEIPSDLVAQLVEGKGSPDLTWGSVRPLKSVMELENAFHKWRKSATITSAIN